MRTKTWSAALSLAVAITCLAPNSAEAERGQAGVGHGSLKILAYVPLGATYRDLFEAWGTAIGFRTSF